MNYLEKARKHTVKPADNPIDQAEIKEWIKSQSGIIQKAEVIPHFEAENQAKREASKRFCVVCKVGDCSGCLLEEALEGRKVAARRVVEQVKQAWARRVSELLGKRMPHDSAIKQASQEALASDIWREGLSAIG
jgi:hypothetical protein